MKSGLYETVYGNTCEYIKESEEAFDLDMLEIIPIEMVDFSKVIREERED